MKEKCVDFEIKKTSEKDETYVIDSKRWKKNTLFR